MELYSHVIFVGGNNIFEVDDNNIMHVLLRNLKEIERDLQCTTLNNVVLGLVRWEKGITQRFLSDVAFECET